MIHHSMTNPIPTPAKAPSNFTLFSTHEVAHQRPPVFERAMIDPRNSTLGFTFFALGVNQKCPLIALSVIPVVGGNSWQRFGSGPILQFHLLAKFSEFSA